jgi:hypothetical protein
MNDYIAAEENDMHFLLRETDGNRNLFSVHVNSVDDLTELDKILNNLS